MRCLTRQVLCVVAGLLVAGVAEAQDQRNVLEPVIPAVCTTLNAELASGATPGSISSETQLDTSRIQAAMNACSTSSPGQAVELAMGGTNDAFLTGPLTIPNGVTLLVDAGVTLYASRNPRDYDASSAMTCGTVDSLGTGCKAVIEINKTVGVGIMGYGTIDGRGYMKMLLNGQPGAESWWDIANDANVNGGSQNNPRLIDGTSGPVDRFTLYKIRLMNSPTFHVFLDVPTNFTAWGVRIVTPFDARNSDGIDPNYGTNVTITQSHISDGDDQVAIGGNKLPGASYYTVENDWFGNGHGLSIGSTTSGGVRHLLAQNLTWSGLSTDSNATAVHIKSTVTKGGVVQDLTYQNICTLNVRYPIWFDPFNSGVVTNGPLLPWYKNILVQNLHSVPQTAPGTVGQVIIQGANSTVPTEVTLDNVVVDGITQSDFVNKFHQTTPSDAIITLGPGPVNFVQFLNTGLDVTVNNNISNSNPPLDCPANNFAPIAGEVIPGAAQIDPGTKPVVQVQVYTTRAVSYQTYKANLATDPNASLALTPPTGTVTVYDTAPDGTVTAVGQATLPGASNSGMQMVPVQLTALPSGANVVTAQYSGDSNYPAFTFGNYAVSVGRGNTSDTSLSLSASSITAGDPVTLTAFVGGHGHSLPQGTVQFTAGSLNIGSAPTNAQGSATLTTSSLTPGTYNVVASFTAPSGATASQSTPVALTVTQIPTTLALTANPASAVKGTPVTITATVSYPSTSLLPSGTVTIKDGSTTIATLALVDGAASFTTSTLAVGTHTLSASYGGDANFVKSSTTGSVTITAQ